MDAVLPGKKKKKKQPPALYRTRRLDVLYVRSVLLSEAPPYGPGHGGDGRARSFLLISLLLTYLRVGCSDLPVNTWSCTYSLGRLASTSRTSEPGRSAILGSGIQLDTSDWCGDGICLHYLRPHYYHKGSFPCLPCEDQVNPSPALSTYISRSFCFFRAKSDRCMIVQGPKQD